MIPQTIVRTIDDNKSEPILKDFSERSIGSSAIEGENGRSIPAGSELKNSAGSIKRTNGNTWEIAINGGKKNTYNIDFNKKGIKNTDEYKKFTNNIKQLNETNRIRTEQQGNQNKEVKQSVSPNFSIDDFSYYANSDREKAYRYLERHNVKWERDKDPNIDWYNARHAANRIPLVPKKKK